MTTYKEKYHLKKTEPMKNKQRILYYHQGKQGVKTQKASTIKIIPVQRRDLRQRYSNDAMQNEGQVAQNNKNNQTMQSQKNQNQSSRDTLNQRPRSVSIVQKFIPSSNYQPLQYPKRNTIHSLERINIIHSVQNFFNRMIRPDNGCVCEEPCGWAKKLFKWVDIPEFLVTQYYQSLKQKIKEGKNNPKDNLKGNPQYFQSIQEQAKQIEKQKSFKQIKKDICRTQSESPTFQSVVFQNRLQNILKCYVIEDIKVGYIQGMNMILSGILYHVKSQPLTYSIFRKLLYSIRSIYLDSFRECYVHINRIQSLIKTYLYDIYVLLRQFDIQLHMICLPWILSLLTSIVPLEDLHLIYYGFIKERWNFIYKVCLSIFVYFKDRIKQAQQASEVLMLFSVGQQQFKEIDWEGIVKYAQKIQITLNN